MADFSNPKGSSGWSTMLSQIRANIDRVLTGFQGGTGDSNVPTNAKRIDNNGDMYYWNGSSWVSMGNIGDGPSAPVDSVNSQTGAVVLDADDISDGATTNKFATAGELSKLAGIASGAEVNPAPTTAGEIDTGTSTDERVVTPALLKYSAETWGGDSVSRSIGNITSTSTAWVTITSESTGLFILDLQTLEVVSGVQYQSLTGVVINLSTGSAKATSKWTYDATGTLTADALNTTATVTTGSQLGTVVFAGDEYNLEFRIDSGNLQFRTVSGSGSASGTWYII